MAWSEARVLEWIGRDAARRDDAARWPANARVWTLLSDAVRHETARSHPERSDPVRAAEFGRACVRPLLARCRNAGARPLWALSSLAAGPECEDADLIAFLTAVEDELRAAGIRLVGGDLSSARSGLASSLCLGAETAPGAAQGEPSFAGEEGEWALSTDQVVEGRHHESQVPPELVGRKLARRGLSDLAATGAEPRWGIGTVVGAPPPGEARERFEAGLREELARFGARCLELRWIPAKGEQVAALAVAGHVVGPGARRSGAAVGAGLYLTGPAGGAGRGRHLHIRPRVEEGVRLVREFGVVTMLDVSDGLALDLHRLCSASGVGARVDAELLPVHPDALAASRTSGRLPIEHALGDGEDHELLFVSALEPEVFRRAGLRVFRIGEILPRAEGIVLREGGAQDRPLAPLGWLHGEGGLA